MIKKPYLYLFAENHKEERHRKVAEESRHLGGMAVENGMKINPQNVR